MRPTAFVPILVALVACHHAATGDLGQPALTLFDGNGDVELATRVDPSTRAAQLSDGQGRVIARGKVDLARADLTDLDGNTVAAERHAGGEPTLTGPRPARLHAEKVGLVRLLDPAGVPIAGFRGDDTDGGAIWDPGGNMTTTLEWAGGRWVIHDRDAHVVGYIAGTNNAQAATAFAIRALPPVERAALALWIDRDSPGHPR